MSTFATDGPTPWQRAKHGANVRVVLGVLLIGAAFAKGLSPVDSAAAVLSGWPFAARLLALEAELMFGVLLVLGAWRHYVHAAAIAVFALFSLVALRSILIGEKSCGCFGALTVDPRLMLLVDVAAVAALSATRPIRGKIISYSGISNRKRAAVGAIAIALTGVPLGVVMANITPARDFAIVPADKFVLLEPETWVGKKLPLLGVLEGMPGLSSGEWTALLYRHGCPDCDRVRPDYESRLIRGDKVLLVEIPPYFNPSPPDVVRQGYARLPADRDWFVQTPVEIVVIDGVVASVDRKFLRNEGIRQ